MDLEQGIQRGARSIPRLSKPPLPLASNNNPRATSTATRREPAKGSSLPRPSRGHGGNIIPSTLFGDHVDYSSRDRYEWNSQNRSLRPVRSRLQISDSPQAVADNVLETTPPSSDANRPLFEEGNENPTQHVIERESRHRMSLSERTVETLSHISPTPSPTRQRRGSLVSYDGRMGPPPRPASQAGMSSTINPSRSKSRSPVKQPFRPPGRSESPSKIRHLPALPSANLTLSLPRASSRVVGSMRLPQRSVSNMAVVNADQNAQSPSKAYSAQTMRVKSPRHDPSHTPSIDKACTDMFSPRPAPSQDRLAVNGTKSGSGFLQSRSRRQNTTASSPFSKAKKAEVSSASKFPHLPSQESSNDRMDSPKSSTALRSAIAKAKAARKDAASRISSSAGESSILTSDGSSVSQQVDDVVISNRGLLRSRIHSALTSGHLNISAMKLECIPCEVMSMYEPDQSSVNWAEVVDLLKFNSADNEITHLDDHVFPDFSLGEVADGEGKANQFGGVESLDLHNNKLNSLPLGLRRLEQLTLLNLSGNKLTRACLDIVWQLPSIQDLNMARNQLTGSIKIPNGSVSKLHRLNLSGNSIDSLILDGDASSPLSSLDVSNNQLADLPWEILASFELVQLNASANRLVTVILNPLLRGFTNLREVDLSNNSIDVIEPELRLPSVQIFAVNNNRLDSLPDISSWHNLITLQAAENNLSEIPQGLIASTSVKGVDFSLNSIKTLDPRIAKMKSLTSLRLTGNPLRDRKFLSMDTEGIKKALLIRLEPDEAVDGPGPGGVCKDKVVSNRSSRSEAYLHTPVNGVLDLGSKIQGADVNLSIINLESPIHTLRLSNNDISAFPTGLLLHPSINGSLKSLDLSHNPLASNTYLAADLHLPALESLYIVSTGLASLDTLLTWLKAPQLRELNISCHRLTGQLPHVRSWYPNCTTLLATDNWFSSVDVDAVRGLEVLDIRNNEIGSLPPTVGLLGNHTGKRESGRLRSFECGGNRFRVPRISVIEKGTEAVLKDLRRMIPEADIPDDWRDEI
ncbi:hypothetical protein DV736_g3475, partial [Chaetothyriales sp. CBS 134916]